MIVTTDICPKSGLKREIEFIKFVDDNTNKIILLDCNLNYYNKDNNEFLSSNIFDKDIKLITISNSVNLNGIGEYDYWKGLLNDTNAMKDKNINSFDSYCAYIIMKAYLDKKFD
jgi:hypothetical protein